MRIGSVLFILGIIVLLQFTSLPPPFLSLLLPFTILAGLKIRWLRWPAWIFCGFLWALFRADIILDDRLPKSLEGEELIAEGKVISLPGHSGGITRFDFSVERLVSRGNIDIRNPGKIRLNWYQYAPELVPGEAWRLRVKLKRPYGFMNPGGFDYEGFLFQERIIATGYVINNAENYRLSRAGIFYLHHVRYRIRGKIESILGDRHTVPLVTALLTGDRGRITPQQWTVLTDTGTNHLLAISGLHIGLIAGLSFLLVRSLWPLTGRISYAIAGPRLASYCAICAALFYAALAGFSIPTQRALIMIGTALVLSSLNRTSDNSSIVCFTLVVVLVIDPFAVMSASFWFSFLAIAVIIFGMSARTDANGFWWKWGRAQWLVGIGLLPLLVLWFQQIPVLSLPANFIAVPWVGMLVVPLIISGTLISYIHPGPGLFLLELGSRALDLLWTFLEVLSQYDFVIYKTMVPGIPALLAAIIGVMLILMPRGWPARWLGVIWLFPVLIGSGKQSHEHLFEFTLLDVGQGLAALVRTRSHTLLYDAGPRYSETFDAGSDVIVPYLKSRGIHYIDIFVASHGDNDHIGGYPQIIKDIEIGKIITSNPDEIDGKKAEKCLSGDSWHWDNISFTVLHPHEKYRLSRNNLSCVLRITDGKHSLLIPGDIEKQAERRLVTEFGKELKSDVLVAPHHGSNTSSTRGFIRQVSPEYVLFPVGYRNRFNFPKRDIINSYHSYGVKTLNTASSGAIEIRFHEEGIKITRYRQQMRRFWHTQY